MEFYEILVRSGPRKTYRYARNDRQSAFSFARECEAKFPLQVGVWHTKPRHRHAEHVPREEWKNEALPVQDSH